MKTALIFLDENTLKVVYGGTLKCIRVSEMRSSDNKKFFERLFLTYQVVTVESATLLTDEDFVSWTETLTQQANAQPVQTPPVKSTNASKPNKQNQAQAPLPQLPEYLTTGPQSLLFRSTEETTIIIDDLLTEQEIPGVPGSKRALAVFPYRAIDIATLPKESVQNSVILKRLIRDGKLVPCTTAEAAQLEAERIREEMQEKKEEQKDLKILDRSVEDFIGGETTSDDVAETIKVTGDDEVPEQKENYSLTELMKMTGAIEDEKEAIPVTPRLERKRAPASALPATTIKKSKKE